MLSQVRLKFWIVNGKSAVKFYLRDCLYCAFRRAKFGQQIMASLPFKRVSSGGRPFSVSGVDFWGPEFVYVSFEQL